VDEVSIDPYIFQRNAYLQKRRAAAGVTQSEPESVSSSKQSNQPTATPAAASTPASSSSSSSDHSDYVPG
jgi:ABC-type transporter lipoprotein component MlaA